MKRSWIALTSILLVCAVSVFALISCNVTLEEMDGDEYFGATDKERSVELVNEFFEETLKDPDFVVTCKDKEGIVQYTETVKGTCSYTLYKDGSETYAFKKGEHFYVARISPSENEAEESVEKTYYCSDSTKPGYYAGMKGGTMEDMYQSDFCRFMGKDAGVNIVKGLSEENATFHCMTHITWLSNYSTGSLDFTYTADNAAITLTASSAGGKVSSVRLVIKESAEGEGDSDLTWEFIYGGVDITLPDTDAWDRENA